MRLPRVRQVLFGLLLAVCTMAASIPVESSQGGGSSPRIAFTRLSESGAQVVTADPDGSDEFVVPLEDPVEDFGVPVWSPDRSRLLISHTLRFTDAEELLPFRPAIVRPDGSDYRLVAMPDVPFDVDCTSWSVSGSRMFCAFGGDEPGAYSVRSSDGGGARRLSTNPFGTMDLPVDVSPDGTRVLILREEPGPPPDPNENERFALFVVGTDGSRFHQIVPYGIVEGDELGSAHWSPDGRRIIASSADGRLLTFDPDGRHLRYMDLGNEMFAFMPNWSPDGRRIVFGLFGPEQEDLFTADPSGGRIRAVTGTGSGALEHGPDWR